MVISSMAGSSSSSFSSTYLPEIIHRINDRLRMLFTRSNCRRAAQTSICWWRGVAAVVQRGIIFTAFLQFDNQAGQVAFEFLFPPGHAGHGGLDIAEFLVNRALSASACSVYLPESAGPGVRRGGADRLDRGHILSSRAFWPCSSACCRRYCSCSRCRRSCSSFNGAAAGPIILTLRRAAMPASCLLRAFCRASSTRDGCRFHVSDQQFRQFPGCSGVSVRVSGEKFFHRSKFISPFGSSFSFSTDRHHDHITVRPGQASFGGGRAVSAAVRRPASNTDENHAAPTRAPG